AAELIWPSTTQSEPEFRTAANILGDLLPLVPEQLAAMGFVRADFEPLLRVISERIDNRQTGSQWQLDKLASLGKDMPHKEALQQMQLQYQKNSLQNIPVSTWR